MKKQVWTKRTIYIWLLIFAAFILLRVGYIYIGNKISREYVHSAEVDISSVGATPCRGVEQTFIAGEQDRLHSLEFLFRGIAVDRQGFVTLRILSGEELLYQAKLSLSNVEELRWKRVYIGLGLVQGREYRILLDASESCTRVPSLLVTNANVAAPEAGTLYKHGHELESVAAIQYGYLRVPGWAEKTALALVWILFLMLAVVLVRHSEQITGGGRKIYQQIFQNLPCGGGGATYPSVGFGACDLLYNSSLLRHLFSRSDKADFLFTVCVCGTAMGKSSGSCSEAL